MPIIKNNKVMQDIYYEGLKLKKVYYEGILVYEDKIYAVILCQWLKEQEVRYEKEISADWQSWEDERSRLYGVLSDAESSLSSYKSREPPKERETADHKFWQNRLDQLEGQLVNAAGKVNAALTKWNQAVEDYDARVEEVNAAASAYESAVRAFNAAVKARDEHKAKEPSKTHTVEKENPDWTTWKTEDDRLKTAYDDANTAYNDASGLAQRYYDRWQTAIIEGNSPETIEFFHQQYLDAQAKVGPAKAAKEAAYGTWQDHVKTEPSKTIIVTEHNPDWDVWDKEQKQLQQKVNSTDKDKDAKKKEADRLSSAWDADEPTYAQNIHDAEAEYDQWKASYDWVNNQITTHKANEPTKYETNPDWTTWNNGLPPYEDAVRNAQSNYDSWYNKQPEKYIDVPYTYFRYISKATLDAPTNKPYSTYVNVYFNYGSGVTSSFRLDRNTKSRTIYSQWYKQLSLDSCSVSVTSSRGESDRASLRVNEQWTSRPLEL